MGRQRKKAPNIIVEMVYGEKKNIQKQVNDVYIRSLKRRMDENNLTAAERNQVIDHLQAYYSQMG
ncbi:MAG: hypothetical protein K2N72_10450 [Oscillospiraceae bacterium]|nr:hypothetical protein [Oscillospiraceae bacterium]